MLVIICRSPDETSSEEVLQFHQAPVAGDLIEIEGTLLTVARAWHKPDAYSTGPKYAVLVEEPEVVRNSAPIVHLEHQRA